MILSPFTEGELRARGYVGIYRFGHKGRALVADYVRLGAPLVIPRANYDDGSCFVREWIACLVENWPLVNEVDGEHGILGRVIRAGMIEKDPSSFTMMVLTTATLGGVSGVRSLLGDRLEEQLLDALIDQGVDPEWTPKR